MQPTIPLEPGHYYHIYPRGNNRIDIFFEERDYHRFLELYAHHITPVADTFAYCLMRNHFHVAVRIRTCREDTATELTPRLAIQSFSNFLNAYAKHINYRHHRTGSLFQKRFKRKPVRDMTHLTHLLRYIHLNPRKHGFVDDFREWPWASYHALRGTSQVGGNLRGPIRQEVLGWFNGPVHFDRFHSAGLDETIIESLVEGDFG